jgi:adenylate kinase
MNNGEFIDDSIILSLIEKEINISSESNGYVMDGFPRNMEQAKAFDDMLHDNHVVIYIEISKDVARNRILGRLYCPECGSSYNEYVMENKPKINNICDKCHSNLVKRHDDTEATLENRFDVYIKHTEPLLEYYRSQDVLHTVDGNQDTIKVHNDIVKILEGEI